MTPTRVKQHRKRKHTTEGHLVLVPFIDMMTILVVFLLLHTADVDILPNTKNISIPQSISEIKPRETIVVMVTRDTVYVAGRAVGTVAEGVASWYGPGYHGKRTSSGEVFNQDALTAAHPTWAFGTKARVTLLSTGRSVVVRINDRFPSHKGRLIDLSRGAARAIGLIGPGTGQVRVEVVG